MRSLLAAVFTATLAGSAPAAVIFSDNFNAQNGGIGQLNFSAFSGWTVSNGTVDLIGNGFFDFYPGNGLYVDLDGSTNNAGDLTTVTTFAAGTYQLTFSLGGNARGGANDQVTVSLGGWSEVFNVPSNFPFQTITRTFTTTGGQLTFSHAGGDNIGAILDNVSVSTVPEPVSLVVFGGLLVGGIAAARRVVKG
jgi:hypothetical protein